jgi:predicted regulator of Ras-like GTPase activity (Roadblock/LC7/MglB family)
LLPDLVKIPEGSDHAKYLPLPAGWLALHFRLITKRKELPPEPSPEPEPIAEEEKPEEKTELNHNLSAESISAATDTVSEEKQQESEKAVPLADEESVASELNPLNQPKVLEAVIEKKRGFFASLPIFRRHGEGLRPVSQESPSTVVNTQATDSVALTRELPPVPMAYEPGRPTEKAVERATITLERLWKLDPQDQIADPSGLQTLFMTEEKLTLERIISLSGQLPGLRACVLATGDKVICASATPAGMDLRNMSTQAALMLSQLRDSSTLMGLGAVPAITLHAEQGVVSFLNQGELCLLVLHADRGFIPGVRERLQEMLGHLSVAKALPASPSVQPSLPI